MEKRTCKLCFRSFSNGRALGGHMRSHMLKLQTITPTTTTPPTTITPPHHQKTLLIHQLHDNEVDLVSSASSSEEDDKGLGCYGLRENPRKSFRLVDPEFSSFAVDACSVVQDRESETGTGASKNLCRRRSKRNRKPGFGELGQHLQNQGNGVAKKPNSGKSFRAEYMIEPEPVSSVSDTSPEEDVAWCLMMLSRGIRTRRVEELVADPEEEDEEEEEDDDEDEEEAEKAIEESDEELNTIKDRVKRRKYQCGTCKKFFRSYQALGGHRASHKKIKGCNATVIATPSSSSAPRPHHESDYDHEGNVVSATIVPDSANRIHECPICFRVFGSGQALGGHKRSHIPGLSTTHHQPTRNTRVVTNANSARLANNLIDLNLPAPMDDDEQIELSAVSDAEFV